MVVAHLMEIWYSKLAFHRHIVCERSFNKEEIEHRNDLKALFIGIVDLPKAADTAMKIDLPFGVIFIYYCRSSPLLVYMTENV